jgi:hypothetical protein
MFLLHAVQAQDVQLVVELAALVKIHRLIVALTVVRLVNISNKAYLY